MRFSSTSPFKHLLPVKWQKFRIFPRSPWKCVDTVKAEDVVDAKNVEDPFDPPNSLPPPIKIVCSHRLPAIKGNTPILSPLLRELVVFEIQLRRRATRPVERENVAMGKHVGAVIANAKRDVAHQSNAEFLRKFTELAPLLMRDPLDVAEKNLAGREIYTLFFGLGSQPGARGFGSTMLWLPFIPRFALPIYFHQSAKK